jgi:DNA-directed RNA polymerase subunit RPC12/RpoP
MEKNIKKATCRRFKKMEPNSTNVVRPQVGAHYEWIALSNATLTALMVSLSGSSILLALPVIFRGIHINPLAPGSFSYLLWLPGLIAWVVIIAGGGMFLLTTWHARNFAYRCPACHHEFEISVLGDLISPNVTKGKYLKCPGCHRRVWTECSRKRDER